MLSLAKKLIRKIRRRNERRALQHRQRQSVAHIPQLPEPPVWEFPAGMTIHAVGDTGVRVVDNFCSAEEAEAVIQIGRETVARSTVIDRDGASVEHAYRTSSDSFLKIDTAAPVVKSIVHRAAALLGVPVSHAEPFSLTRYGSDEYYKSHLDHDGSLKADRLYTVLLYLNGLDHEDGGGTHFEKLNFVSQPVAGRAVMWVNSDRQKQALPESRHASLPVTNDSAEKWVAQMWFRAYEFSVGATPAERADVPPGKPLTDNDALPAGLFIKKAAKPE